VSLALFLIEFVPFVDDLCKLVVIVAIPPVPLCFEVDFGAYSCSSREYFILREVPLLVLNAHLPGSLSACLVVMCDGPAVSAGTLPVLGDLLLVSAHSPTVPSVIQGLLLVVSRTLMDQSFFLLGLIICKIPRGLLDILRHVCQIDVWLATASRGWGILAS
jgi:hypothetical protein